MSLARTDRLVAKPGVVLETLPLAPHEFFVLSRVEGRPTVGEIIGLTGLGASQTETILLKLIELGALEIVDAPRARPRQSTQELRAQAAERRLRSLQQTLGAVRSSSSTSIPAVGGEASPAAATPAASTPAAPPASAPAAPPPGEPAPLELPKVAADDPRLEPGLGLSVDDQRMLLALDDRRGDLTPFELLGLHPTHDLKAIREAFRLASRRFHPDAYKGRSLGRFAGVLSTLFADAKAAHAALQKEEVRAPLVAVVEAAKAEAEAEARRREQQREAARQAAEELKAKLEQEQLVQRAAERTAQRAQRERERAAALRRAQVAEHVKAAQDAEGMENYARAANSYRLALELAPDDAELRARWEEVRGTARRRRAKDAFARAMTFLEVGHLDQARMLLAEAAEADPTLEHVAHAADALKQHDPKRAVELAMTAMRLLAEAEHGPMPLRPNTVADLRMMIARAFLAAQLVESAREQATLVLELRPKDPEARALLKSAKVT